MMRPGKHAARANHGSSSGWGAFALVALIGIPAIIWGVNVAADMAVNAASDYAAAHPTAPPEPPPPAPVETDEDRRSQAVLLQACLLRNAMREPDSVDWLSIGADDSAGTICFRYRARNGFGGMTIGRMAVHNGTPAQSTAAWNKYCATPQLHDMTWEKENIRPSLCNAFRK